MPHSTPFQPYIPTPDISPPPPSLVDFYIPFLNFWSLLLPYSLLFSSAKQVDNCTSLKSRKQLSTLWNNNSPPINKLTIVLLKKVLLIQLERLVHVLYGIIVHGSRQTRINKFALSRIICTLQYVNI